MKRNTQVLLWLLCGYAALGQGTFQIVVPNAQANVEGNSSATDLMTASSFRLQMVFDASQFSSLSSAPGVSNSLTRIYFRIDGASSAPGVQSVFGGSTIQLSTTTRSPDSLSPVFADNVGADVTTIYVGAAAFGAGYFPSSNPQPFENSIPVSNPFFYIPTQGNLLLDIRGRSGQVLLPGALDAQSTVGDSVSRIFANSELFASGTADSLGLVARFDFTVVPEPSTCALLLIGLGLMFVFRRGQSRHSSQSKSGH